jgi:hypothetical protein
MLYRESLVITKTIFLESGWHRLSRPNQILFQLPSIRSMAAATKTKALTKQNWRKTRKKVGPLATNTHAVPAENDEPNDTRVATVQSNATEKISPNDTNTSPTNTNPEAPKSIVNGEPQEFSWVPPAYRGMVDETKRGNSVTRHKSEMTRKQGLVRSRKVTAPKSDVYILRSKDGIVEVPSLGLPEQAIVAKQQKEENVLLAVNALINVATSYRKHLHGNDFTTFADTENESSTLPSSKFIQYQIGSALRAIHTDGVTGLKRLHDSGPDFRSICQLLQQICSTAFSLSTLRRYNDRDANKYIDLAEFALMELVQINYDRSNLLSPQTNEKKITDDEEFEASPNSQQSMTGWFNKLVEGLTPSLLASKSANEPNDAEEKELRAELAIDDATLQSMKRLLKNVMASLASTTKPPEVLSHMANAVTNVNVNDQEERSLCDKVAQRMIALLDSTSTILVCDSEAIQSVMEVLSRAGTLKCARQCNDLYQKYVSTDRRISFAIVLEAYLEATKQEKDSEALLVIIEEVKHVLTSHLNVSKSTHRAERILHAAIVLNCLAAAEMGKVDGMCEGAEFLVKRAIGGKVYSNFLEEVQSDDPTVDNLLLPIANYLAQLYATSGQPILVSIARKLLIYCMTDSDGFSAFTIFPTSEACNAVLQTLVEYASADDSSLAKQNYFFARKVLKFMFSKTEMGCCPNSTTYDCLFTLLEAANPREIGLIGDDLLSYIETSNLFYVSNTFTLPLNTYHRVLQYYLQMAKDADPCLITNERNIPYRRAAHLLRKLEVRSTPMVLNSLVLGGEIAVENLYFPKLQPRNATYILVMQICANTSHVEYQAEAADVAMEIYQTMSQTDTGSNNMKSWDTILENCTNEKLVEHVKDLTEVQMET